MDSKSRCPLKNLNVIVRILSPKIQILLSKITNLNHDVSLLIIHHLRQLLADGFDSKLLTFFVFHEDNEPILFNMKLIPWVRTKDKKPFFLQYFGNIPIIPYYLPIKNPKNGTERYFTKKDFLTCVKEVLDDIQGRCIEGDDIYCQYLYTLLLIYDERIGKLFSDQLINCHAMKKYWQMLKNGQENIYRIQMRFYEDDYSSDYDHRWHPKYVNQHRLGFVLP